MSGRERILSGLDPILYDMSQEEINMKNAFFYFILLSVLHEMRVSMYIVPVYEFREQKSTHFFVFFLSFFPSSACQTL